MVTKIRRSNALEPPDGMIPHASDAPATELPGGDAIVSAAEGEAPRIDVIGKNPLKAMGGSERPSFNSVLLRKTLSAVDAGQLSDNRADGIAAAAAALAAFRPVDEIEGMLAAQAVAMHYSAMECFRRASLGDQPADIASKLRKDGANLARGMVDMVEALNRKRGKGSQVVRVERVVVHEGGQAVVGNVQTGGSGG